MDLEAEIRQLALEEEDLRAPLGLGLAVPNSLLEEKVAGFQAV